MAKIAFLSNSTDLLTWAIEEAKSFDFTSLVGTTKPADAYIVITDKANEIDKFLPYIEERMFAWFGPHDERVKSLHPYIALTWDEITDGEIILTTANDMHQQIEAERAPSKPKRSLLNLGRRDTEADDTTEIELDPQEIKVIAIGGARGAGASFVAWNLAAVTNLPLMEGRRTGSLAVWTADNISVEQALADTLPYGTVTDDIPSLSILTKQVIVDCGSDPQHPIFDQALTRIWVTSLDPAAPRIPERTKVVVNRVPTHLPFDPREAVKTDIALIVPDGGLDALLSLYTHVPWITKQPPEVQKAWRALIAPQGGKS